FILYDVWSRTALGRWTTARDGAFFHAAKSLVFFQAVCAGWLLFRSDSLVQAASIARSIVGNFSVDATAVNAATKLALFAVPLLGFQIYQKRFGLAPWEDWHPETQMVAVTAAGVLVALVGAP